MKLPKTNDMIAAFNKKYRGAYIELENYTPKLIFKTSVKFSIKDLDGHYMTDFRKIWNTYIDERRAGQIEVWLKLNGFRLNKENKERDRMWTLTDNLYTIRVFVSTNDVRVTRNDNHKEVLKIYYSELTGVHIQQALRWLNREKKGQAEAEKEKEKPKDEGDDKREEEIQIEAIMEEPEDENAG